MKKKILKQILSELKEELELCRSLYEVKLPTRTLTDINIGFAQGIEYAIDVIKKYYKA